MTSDTISRCSGASWSKGSICAGSACRVPSPAQARELITLAVFDLPYGSIRRHLLAGTAPPAAHRPYVELAIRAVLGAAASGSGEEGGI